MPNCAIRPTAGRKQAAPKKQLEQFGGGQTARFRCTLPYEKDNIDALSSDEKYRFTVLCGDVQSAIAGRLIAADSIQTAEFGPPSPYAPLDGSTRAGSSRWVGFADGRLLRVAPWCAAVG